MADGVDGGAEDEVFEAAVAVRGHDDEIRVDFFDGRFDFFRRIVSVPDNDIDVKVLVAQSRDDAREIILALGDFGGG